VKAIRAFESDDDVEIQQKAKVVSSPVTCQSVG
jgi:hypothetical protein